MILEICFFTVCVYTPCNQNNYAKNIMILLSKITTEAIGQFFESTMDHTSNYALAIEAMNKTREQVAAYLAYKKCRRLCHRYSRLYLGGKTKASDISNILDRFIDIQFKLILLIWLLKTLVSDEFFHLLGAEPSQISIPPTLLKKSFTNILIDLKINWNFNVFMTLSGCFLGRGPSAEDYFDLSLMGKEIASKLQPSVQVKNTVEADLLSGSYGFNNSDVSRSSLECSKHFLVELERVYQLPTKLQSIPMSIDIKENPDSNARYLMFVLLVYANNIDLKSKRSNQSFNKAKPRQNMMRFILAGVNQYLIASGKNIDTLFPNHILSHLRQYDLEQQGGNRPWLAATSTDL